MNHEELELRERCFAWVCELPSMDPGGQATTERLVAFVKYELARAMRSRRLFPIMDGKAVPWALLERCERQALENHYQTLARLAERGGLSPSEALAVLESRPLRTLRGRDEKADAARLEQLVRESWEVERDELRRRVAELEAARAKKDPAENG